VRTPVGKNRLERLPVYKLGKVSRRHEIIALGAHEPSCLTPDAVHQRRRQTLVIGVGVFELQETTFDILRVDRRRRVRARADVCKLRFNHLLRLVVVNNRQRRNARVV
jgi:hypothetical protein